ncbi:hypothetical protein RRF57_007980 [Xylaria bambusicola]|uniref:NADP-dependent oxidoreductase domain-containing protein n=1 Tax=Xylaria bambusicola TaxID=326684 RepID=A0AAN7USY2_9PEZI
MKTAINNDFYGIADPTVNISLIRRYFEQYPEDVSKVILSIKRCTGPKTFHPTNSSAATRASLENILRIICGAKNIDIFFPSRSDPNITTEEPFNELKVLVSEGEIKGVGLSEAGPETIKKAHAVIPFSVVEVNEIPTNGVAATYKSLNIPIIAYSTLGRGFPTGQLKKLSDVLPGDVRLYFDRFQPEDFDQNLEFADKLNTIAAKKGVLANSDSAECGTIVSIPGATTAQRVEENTITELTARDKAELDTIVKSVPIVGGRYSEYLQKGL